MRAEFLLCWVDEQLQFMRFRASDLLEARGGTLRVWSWALGVLREFAALEFRVCAHCWSKLKSLVWRCRFGFQKKVKHSGNCTSPDAERFARILQYISGIAVNCDSYKLRAPVWVGCC